MGQMSRLFGRPLHGPFLWAPLCGTSRRFNDLHTRIHIFKAFFGALVIGVISAVLRRKRLLDTKAGQRVGRGLRVGIQVQISLHTRISPGLLSWGLYV